VNQLSTLAAQISASLKPRSVLGIGDAAQLLEALSRRGIETKWANPLVLRENVVGQFDLAVCSNLACLSSDGSLIIRKLADVTGRLLLLSDQGLRSASETASLLTVFAEAGFVPDISQGEAFFAERTILFRKQGEAEATSRESLVLLAELLRLNEKLRLCLTHQQELESTVRLLEERFGWLRHVTRHIETIVLSMFNSRIWQTLVTGGSFLLRLTGWRPSLARSAEPGQTDYQRWIASFERRDESGIALKLATWAWRPALTVLLIARRPADLERAIASVLRQSYPGWEFRILASGTAAQAVSDPRIRWIEAGTDSWKAIVEPVSGEFIVLLDSGDELAEDALFHFADAINREPEAEVFYSDEDRIDEHGVRSQPFFKPDWSPYLILSQNYIGGTMMIRRDLLASAGAFHCDFSSYELALRMSRDAKRIVHVPKVLYHRRAPQQEPPAAERRALEDHLHEAGINAAVETGLYPGRWRVRYSIPEGLRVRIIIPSGGKIEFLERCLNSVAGQTDYPHYEILVVDNSRSERVERLVRRWSRGGRRAGYLDYRNRPFNFSEISNAAARQCDAPLLLFLNDDTSVITPGWLTAMVELASRPNVGAVGAKLLYANGGIQHVGVVIGLFDLCSHAFKGAAGAGRHYFDFPDVIRDVSAVTGACMMVPAKLFWQCGGFDTENFPVAYQDVDLCLKLRQQGYQVLFTPHAQLYHYEAISKRVEHLRPDLPEVTLFQTRWRQFIEHDPFYSPNLTRNSEDYSCRKGI